MRAGPTTSHPGPALSTKRVCLARATGLMELFRLVGLLWIGVAREADRLQQFRDIFHAIDPVLRQRPSQATANLNRCKSLCKFIQTQRVPPWPTHFASNSIPERGLADRLVHCYLQTIETVYRILHIPTFQKEYEGIWRAEYNSDQEQDRAIQIQLKLVLALGAVAYDESFSLRASALQWIYEAHAWASVPDFKLHINNRYLQNSILLLLARELVGVGGDLLWVSAGSLIRTAMYMGLHRDPARLPNRSFLDSEMHRRLWNTILEVSLSASMSSGGPVLISLSDFETPPPGNFDDEQLVMPTTNSGGQGNHHQQRPLPRPEGDWTETSVAVAFRQTFPLRLAIAKILNDLSSAGTYQETLKLDAELRATYKVLCQTLQKCRESSDRSSNRGRHGPAQFASNWVDFQMHRFLSALHWPFFGAALDETAYAFSRKVVVDTSLKIWRVVYPGPSSSPGPQPTVVNNPADRRPEDPRSQEDDNFLARLAICGAGYIRTVPLLAAAGIAAELRTQLREESTSLGPVSVRPDLLAVVHGAKAWRLKCLSAGEINIKAFMLASLVGAQIDGLVQGLGKQGLTMFLVDAAEKAGAEALGVFEEMAAKFLHNGYSTGTAGVGTAGVNGVDSGAVVGALYLDEMSLGGGGTANSSAGTSVDFMEGWDFMVSTLPVCPEPASFLLPRAFGLPPSLEPVLTLSHNSIRYQK